MMTYLDRRAYVLLCTLALAAGCPGDDTSSDGTEGADSTSTDGPTTTGVTTVTTMTTAPMDTGTTSNVDSTTGDDDDDDDDDATTTTGDDDDDDDDDDDSTSTGDDDDDDDDSTSTTTGDTEGSTSTGMMMVDDDTIYEVQDGTIGTGQDVDLQGVFITGIHDIGFFAQEPGGGEYSGVFVRVGSGNTAGLSLWDEVDIIGTTNEDGDLTEVDAQAGSVTQTGGTMVLTAASIGTDVLEAEGTGEPWEGVLVQVSGAPLTVSGEPGFSEFYVTDDMGTGETRIDNFLYSVYAEAMAFPNFGLGASFSSITGPVNFTFGEYKIAPRMESDLPDYMEPGAGPATSVEDLMPGDLVVTEIMYDPSCGADGCEWIEIYNATIGSVDLDGLIVRDSTDMAGTEGTIVGETLLGPNGYGVIARGDAMSFPYMSFTPLGFYGGTPDLNNDGDAVIIRNSTAILDQTAAWMMTADAEGYSWRLDPATNDAVSNDMAANWCHSPSPFETVGIVDEQGSPGVANGSGCEDFSDSLNVDELMAGDLVITEVMFNPAVCSDATCEWFEIFNASGSSVNLLGLQVQDENFSATGTVTDSVTIPAGGYAIVGVGDAMSWGYMIAAEAYFGDGPAFNNSGDDLVAILDTMGNIIDQTALYPADAAPAPGASWQLDAGNIDAVANDMAGNWCFSSMGFEGTDVGTPSAANETCM